jgi:hypothetical protein
MGNPILYIMWVLLREPQEIVLNIMCASFVDVYPVIRSNNEPYLASALALFRQLGARGKNI